MLIWAIVVSMTRISRGVLALSNVLGLEKNSGWGGSPFWETRFARLKFWSGESSNRIQGVTEEFICE
jgi:hypothetical protein